VIDFGTGTGTYAFALAKARPDLHVVALDEQPEMLRLLRAKPELAATPNVEPAGSDMVPAFFGRADRVLAINVLHELGDAALFELRRLLKRDGVVAFIDWNAEADRPVGPPRDHTYSAAEARARLAVAGLRATRERLFPYHYALAAVSTPLFSTPL